MAGAIAAATPPMLALMTDEQLLSSIDAVISMLNEWKGDEKVVTDSQGNYPDEGAYYSTPDEESAEKAVNTNGAEESTEQSEPTADVTESTADASTGDTADSGTTGTTETDTEGEGAASEGKGEDTAP